MEPFTKPPPYEHPKNAGVAGGFLWHETCSIPASAPSLSRVWRAPPDWLTSSGCRARAVLRRSWDSDRRVPAPEGIVAALLLGGPADLPDRERRGHSRGALPADLEPARHPAGAHRL